MFFFLVSSDAEGLRAVTEKLQAGFDAAKDVTKRAVTATDEVLRVIGKAKLDNASLFSTDVAQLGALRVALESNSERDKLEVREKERERERKKKIIFFFSFFRLTE